MLVHGLSGHPRLTWTAPKNGMFWPSQLLPTTLKNTHARVLVYGYKADVVAFGSDKSARYVGSHELCGGLREFKESLYCG